MIKWIENFLPYLYCVESCPSYPVPREMIQEVKRAQIHTSYDLKEFKKDLKALNG